MTNKKSVFPVAMSEETPANLHAAGQANAKGSADIIHQNGAYSQDQDGAARIFEALQQKAACAVAQVTAPETWDEVTRNWIYQYIDIKEDHGTIYIDGSPTTKYIKRRKGAGRVNIATAANAYIVFKEALNLELEEIEALEIIASFNRDGQTVAGMEGSAAFTAGQFYGRQRHGQGTATIDKKRKDEIDKLLEKLSNKKIEILVSKEALEILKLNPKDFGAWLEVGKTWVLPVMYLAKNLDAKLNGKPDTLYIADRMPLLNIISSALNCGVDYPQSMNAIKQRDETSGDWKAWNLTTKRIRTRAVLKMYVQEAYSLQITEKKRGLKSKIPFATIAKLSSRDKQRNAKRELAEIASEAETILDWWKEVGIIKNWSKYTNKGRTEPDGVAVTMFDGGKIEGGVK